MNIGIAGSGLVGRLLAIDCLQRGWAVTLFDEDGYSGEKSAAYVAAGMISPFAELDSGEPLLCELGLKSLALWPSILQSLSLPVDFYQRGAVILAHTRDAAELKRFSALLAHKNANASCQLLNRAALQTLIPELAPDFAQGLFLEQEAHIDTPMLLNALAHQLQSHPVTWHTHTKVLAMHPHTITTHDQQHVFDWVFDCRGLGAQSDLPNLRGVRGEVLWLEAPDVPFVRPIRLLHPRHPIYIVPRRDHRFIIGATTIESEDERPITVQSTLELLSAAYTLHHGFSTAHVLQSFARCRPAFANHLPKIMTAQGLTRINGLYRHGFLFSPILVQEVLNHLQSGQSAIHFPTLWYEGESYYASHH